MWGWAWIWANDCGRRRGKRERKKGATGNFRCAKARFLIKESSYGFRNEGVRSFQKRVYLKVNPQDPDLSFLKFSIKTISSLFKAQKFRSQNFLFLEIIITHYMGFQTFKYVWFPFKQGKFSLKEILLDISNYKQKGVPSKPYISL